MPVLDWVLANTHKDIFRGSYFRDSWTIRENFCTMRKFLLYGKPQGKSEWFKAHLERTIQINHDKASLSGLCYHVKQLVSTDTTVPMIYGSYTLPNHDHSVVEGRQWYF